MPLGKGTLSELERLKAEYREKFKAEAPKVRRINQKCLDLLCTTAIGRVGLDRGGRLRTKRATCTNKRCPRECKGMIIDWYGCYKGGWRNEIVPEAFSHPAKFARGLIRRIYEHALECGYLREGDTVLDPFGGVALGAADALANGLNFVGVELEQNFVDMGGGSVCTGISKDDWVRCFGRWERFAHKDARRWCPRCLAEAGLVLEDWEPALPGMETLTVSYKRNSGKIPHTAPHHYTGNLDLFAKHAKNGATAVLVQGDSRNLVEALEGARAEGIISSPPFTNILQDKRHGGGIDKDKLKHPGKVSGGQLAYQNQYGTDPAQLGNMPTGEPPSAVITSPPLGKAQSGGTSFWEGLEEKHNRTFSDRVREGSHGYREDQLGNSKGQLGAMPTGEPPQAIIASPPYIDSADCGGQQRGGAKDLYAESGDRYGKSEGQLAAMREGDVDAVIASPPYIGSVNQSDGANDTDARIKRKAAAGVDVAKPVNIGGPNSVLRQPQEYGNTDGQLAALPEGEPPAGIVSSPPYEGSLDHAPGNVAWEGKKSGNLAQVAYSESDNNLGNQQSDTFWSAARAILLQCYQVLAPGGVAIFVTKRFVRNGEIVEFSQQWADLCQACGFELIEWIKAWLVEERGTQYDLEGEAHTKTVKRFSFFRRLHAQKYPHLAIEWEDVLIFRKGER